MSLFRDKKLGLSSLELTLLAAYAITTIIGFAVLMDSMSDFTARNPGTDIKHPWVFVQ